MSSFVVAKMAASFFALASFVARHCEEPTGPAFGGPNDKLRDEAIYSCCSNRLLPRSLSSGAHSHDLLARNDGFLHALTLSPSQPVAASRPPLPCGISSALRPTSTTPRVPRIIGALTCPI